MANEKRLIDASEADPRNLAYPVFPGCRPYNQYEQGFNDAVIACYGLLTNAPTVEAVEVVHGRWIEKVDMIASYLAECEETFYECSVCNSANFGESPYCPNCGAKMDGEGMALDSGYWETDKDMNVPTKADLVQVVRCKDCVHYVNLLGSGSDYRCSIFCGCYDRPYPTNADDFCSYGERKEA